MVGEQAFLICNIRKYEHKKKGKVNPSIFKYKSLYIYKDNWIIRQSNGENDNNFAICICCNSNHKLSYIYHNAHKLA